MADQFEMKFFMDNSAFCDDDHPGEKLQVAKEEIKRIFNTIAYQLDQGSGGGLIADLNGNTIGSWDTLINEEEYKKCP
jgi:hypothetical protein